MCGHKIKDRIRRKSVGVASIVEKMIESRLSWFSHVYRRYLDVLVRIAY